MAKRLRVLELCAGAGGQALGFEQAGFEHAALVELDGHACRTLRFNRPHWDVRHEDLNNFDGSEFAGVDVIAAGLPCPPFSKAGKQLGSADERNLFPAALDLIRRLQPRAIVIENVRGILDAVFADYRTYIANELPGYWTDWHLLNASDYGVSQLRPRVNFVAIRRGLESNFRWPTPSEVPPPTVGELLVDLMKERGWAGAEAWKSIANEIAPTLVGGSKKHGGPDLGPTRARRAWEALGVNGKTLADAAPDRDFQGIPRLTVRMAARIQGFPDDWQFVGGKTAAYRQVGNAFPPPVAKSVAAQVRKCLEARASLRMVG
ncbi:DNA (cytosine-5)-methyltransferase 1 [Bryocella elongata]|uniref:Cytosine-specific methyltransferase n=1 Tax=Bryocella elongata TaxID=863522 RepID=A0A1H5XMU3_9BACT|nr:DNA cytosine methyltransferase [Bryocella elongata]SEG12737.1 DNA (cytosine-5)-methyltransferase 1 [Bryocella elongata]